MYLAFGISKSIDPLDVQEVAACKLESMALRQKVNYV